MLEEEKRLFKERVSEKQKDLFAAERLVALRMQEDYIGDEKMWWNKLQTMTEREYSMMPAGFIKKYGSYITNIQRFNREWHFEENKSIQDNF